MRHTGFIKIRRGLREHLRFMSGNAVKLYLWLHLTANYSGPKRGCVESDYEEIARSLGWTKKTLQRAIVELKPRFIEVRLAVNQNEVTVIKILKYDRPEVSSAMDTSVHPRASGVDAGVDTSLDKSVHSDVHTDKPKLETRKDLQTPKKLKEGIEGVEAAAASLNSLSPWMVLGSGLPMGSPRFQKIFEHYFATRNGNPLSEAMERAIQRANKERVGVPPKFYEAKRAVERREADELSASAVSAVPELEAEPWAK